MPDHLALRLPLARELGAAHEFEILRQTEVLQNPAGEDRRFGGSHHEPQPLPAQPLQQLPDAVVRTVFEDTPLGEVFAHDPNRLAALTGVHAIEVAERIGKRRSDKAVELLQIRDLDSEGVQGVADGLGDSLRRIGQRAVQIEQHDLAASRSFHIRKSRYFFNKVRFCCESAIFVAMETTVLIPLLLTLGAGLATGIGSAIAFFARPTNKRLLAFMLGLSGGVMIYVSFAELFPQAQRYLQTAAGERQGSLYATLALFGGMLLIGVIDRLVPSAENPHEPHRAEEMKRRPRHGKLMRMGVMTALAIGIHNLPEGIATFMTAMDDTTLGIAIAVAIAIHNIPEGIAVAIPVYYATGDRRKPSGSPCSRDWPSRSGRCSPGPS